MSFECLSLRHVEFRRSGFPCPGVLRVYLLIIKDQIREPINAGYNCPGWPPPCGLDFLGAAASSPWNFGRNFCKTGSSVVLLCQVRHLAVSHSIQKAKPLEKDVQSTAAFFANPPSPVQGSAIPYGWER